MYRLATAFIASTLLAIAAPAIASSNLDHVRAQAWSLLAAGRDQAAADFVNGYDAETDGAPWETLVYVDRGRILWNKLNFGDRVFLNGCVLQELSPQAYVIDLIGDGTESKPFYVLCMTNKPWGVQRGDNVVVAGVYRGTKQGQDESGFACTVHGVTSAHLLRDVRPVDG